MDEASRRVSEAAADARSDDDSVTVGSSRPFDIRWENDIPYPIDEETLDEQASTQMGPAGMRRRDADE